MSSSIRCPLSRSIATSSGAWAPSTVAPTRSASTRMASEGSSTVSKRDERHPVGEPAGRVPAGLECEPALAHPAGPDEREDPAAFGQQPC